MNLGKLRKEIDQIDNKIISYLEKRFSITKKIRKYKSKITDKKREKEILEKIHSKYIQDIYKIIFKISKKLQKES